MDKDNEIQLAEKLLDYPESEWDELITEWCGHDENLKRNVLQIANQNRNARNFVEELQNRIYSLTKSTLKAGANQPDEIAGYKILHKIGSGSSANVFLVENTDGQKGALKLLRRTLADSTSRLRFESEQQILASLSHPNIARLIEGGITDMGEPYVIMEYVDGIPIDEWCEQNQPGMNKRIRLFQAVCRAVHYAHQNLVVHRDIKPEHVLVTRSGEIKLIDFGIAKLLEPARPEVAALKTRTGMRIMTPEFASPEQVRGEPVTTASDIYSLGVLLYLVISGRKPYRFRTTSMLEVERVVCEKDPLKPSEAVTIPDHEPSTASGIHNLEPHRLKKILSGDLDRIVLMAMRKEASKRYASALAFANDLENYLQGEPVLARAPTLRYRARKFIIRHKWAVSAASAAVVALILGLAGTLWQSHQARLHAQRAETQAQIAGQVTDFLVDLFESGDPAVTQGTEITIEQLLERGVQQALEPGQEASVQLNLLSVLGRVYSGMGVHNKSAELFETALKKTNIQNPADPLLLADLQSRLGLNHRIMGNLAAADSLYHLALNNRKAALGENHPQTIQSFDEWAGVHAYLSRDADLADSLFQDVVKKRRAVLDPYDENLAKSLNNLAYIKTTKGEYHQALRYYRESADIYRIALGENHPDRLRAMSGLAVTYNRIGNFGRSEQMYNNLIEARTNVLGENHPQVAVSYFHLAELLKDTGRIEQALTAIQKSDEIMQNLESPHQFYPDILLSKANLFELSGDTELAAESFHKTVQTCAEIRGSQSPGCLRIYQATGVFFLEQKMNNEARNYLQRAYDGYNLRPEPGHEQLTRLKALIESTE